MLILGSGPPLVVIPGLDGHVSWLRPALDALARHFTVVALPLCGERGSGLRFDASAEFEMQLAYVENAMRQAGVARAAMCGVSYGGYIALSYAARFPDRVTALMLVSSPPPGFKPNPRQTRQLGSPLKRAPEFVLTAPRRLLPEICAALPGWGARVRFTAGHLLRVASTGLSPTRMARRMSVAAPIDFFDACRRVQAPTLILTGEPGLDRVVPVEETRKYATLIPGSELVTLRGTGHIGTLTQPRQFADTIVRFAARAAERGEQRQRLPRVG